ncbi:hypothetical protein KC19_2G014400 [Ceratodon purpureus]|uniref:Uncharacterized protein n=1 Tax=Ceratodon purpureus TaxID=3225 RepID=A0A8T0INZ2_CERPU|nr:hypothetical protein KC19_2G014400 [Ceratodon purpureus]
MLGSFCVPSTLDSSSCSALLEPSLKRNLLCPPFDVYDPLNLQASAANAGLLFPRKSYRSMSLNCDVISKTAFHAYCSNCSC